VRVNSTRYDDINCSSLITLHQLIIRALRSSNGNRLGGRDDEHAYSATLKTQDWKTRRDLRSMESRTKHKCRNDVERESKATAQKHRYQKLRS